MARSWFGGTSADQVVRPFNFGVSIRLAALAAFAEVTFWDAVTGGTRHLDLLLAGASPADAVPADEHGYLPRFQGPDGVQVMWADMGDGTPRRLMVTTAGAIAAAEDLASKIDVVEKGAIDGVAELGPTGKVVQPVPAANLEGVLDQGNLPEHLDPADLSAEYAAKPDNGNRAVGKDELVFNVLDHGVDPELDCTAAVEALMLAVSTAGGGTILFPPGRYPCAGPLHARDDVTLQLADGAWLERTTSGAGPWLCNADFATKVSRFRITGHGKIGATSHAVTGQTVFLRGDDILLADFTIDTYAGGQAVLIGGDRNRLTGLQIVNPADAAGVGGIRMFGGRNFRAVGCHVEAGDDALQFTPIASAEPAACRNLTIRDAAYIACTGGSTEARFMVAIMSTSPPGSGGLTCSVRDVSFVGCHGYGQKRGIVLANTDSSGEIANVGVLDCSIDMTGATAMSQDVRIERAAGAGRVRDIRFNGLRVIAPPTTSLGTVGNATTGEHVENVTLTDCMFGAPADGGSTLSPLGVDGFIVRGGRFEGGSGNYVIVGGTAANASKRVHITGARITGVSDGWAGVRLSETVGYRIRDCIITPAAGSTTAQGVSLTASTSGGVIEGNDLSALPGTKVAGTVAAGTVIRDNAGLVTRNSGQDSVASAATAKAVTHGLGRTPAVSQIQLTPANATAAAQQYHVSAANATTFTITLAAAPGASATFNWAADVAAAI